LRDLSVVATGRCDMSQLLVICVWLACHWRQAEGAEGVVELWTPETAGHDR